MKNLLVVGTSTEDTQKRFDAISEINNASTEVLVKLAELKKLPKAENLLVNKFNTIKMFAK
jgi:hypothetical protein